MLTATVLGCAACVSETASRRPHVGPLPPSFLEFGVDQHIIPHGRANRIQGALRMATPRCHPDVRSAPKYFCPSKGPFLSHWSFEVFSLSEFLPRYLMYPPTLTRQPSAGLRLLRAGKQMVPVGEGSPQRVGRTVCPVWRLMTLLHASSRSHGSNTSW